MYEEKKVVTEEPSIIYKDPLKSKKKSNSYNVKNIGNQFEIQKLSKVEIRQFLGIEDVFLNSKVHTTSAVCEVNSEVLVMSKEDFLKLRYHPVVWSTLTEKIGSKVDRMKQAIVLNRDAEVQLVVNIKKV